MLTMNNSCVDVAFREENVLTVYKNEEENEKEYEFLNESENENELHNMDIENILEKLKLNTGKKVRLLQQIAYATKRFLGNLDAYWDKAINENKETFKHKYAKTLKWKKCKIIGSINKNACLNNYANADIILEYDFNIKLARKRNYTNFPIYHNVYIKLLKQFFVEKDFLNFLQKENVIKGKKWNVAITIHKWLNKFKSVLFLNFDRSQKNIGSIKIILSPSEKVQLEFLKLCRNEEEEGESEGNVAHREKGSLNKRENASVKKGSISCNGLTSTIVKNNKMEKKILDPPTRKLLSFLLTECYIQNCEDIVKKTAQDFPHFNKAVKLLKLWCLNKKLLYVDTFENETFGKKESRNKRFFNFSYFGGINSFALCLFCSYVCYKGNLDNCDFRNIFKYTIQFISSINCCDHFFIYRNDKFEMLKHEQLMKHEHLIKHRTSSLGKTVNVNRTPPVFLIDSLYEIFQNNRSSLIELIKEAKKATYNISTSNYYQLFMENNTCFKMNYEEEILFPFFFKKPFFHSDKKIAYIKKRLITGLADRVEELTFRFVTFHYSKSKQRNKSRNSGNEQNTYTNKFRSSTQLVLKQRENRMRQSKRVKAIGVSFFLKTNDTVRYIDSTNCIYKMGRISSFKKFWKNKAKVVRAKNNTICEVVNWKVPGKKLGKKNMAHKDFFLKTKNEVFDGLFSELYENKTKSVHRQIITCILKKLSFKECFHLDKCSNKWIKRRKGKRNSEGKRSSFDGTVIENGGLRKQGENRNGKKSPFVYFSNPLLVKDLFYSYYKIILEKFHEIKNLLYGINEKSFTITNITSSNNFLKMADLGRKKKKVEVIEIVVDVNFEQFIFRDGQMYFTRYEIAKKIISSKLKTGSFSKIETKNFCIDICDDTNYFIFRLHIITSFVYNKPLMQITNFPDVQITTVECLEEIKKFIYKPLVSSFIAVYSQKFPSFHISLKICKIWFMCKGFYFCDDLVEHVLFYIFKKEFKTYNEISTFFDREDLPIHNKSLTKYSQLYSHFYKCQEEQFSEEMENKNLKKLTAKKNGNEATYSNRAAKGAATQNGGSSLEVNRSKSKKRKRRHEHGREAESKGKKKTKGDDEEKKDTDPEKHISTFSLSSKVVLIKFLQFLANFEWTKKPLLIDFDDQLDNSKKKKMKNSFLKRKQNGEEKPFWISSIFDPHCILITLPQNAFHAIINQAKYTLQRIGDFHENLEKEKWMTLFLMEPLTWDLRLNFKSPQKICLFYKTRAKWKNNVETENQAMMETGIREENGIIKEEAERGMRSKQDIHEAKTKTEGITNNEIHKSKVLDEEVSEEEEVYDFSYVHNVKKENVGICDIIKKLDESELIMVYKKYVEVFITNIEQRFASKINILFNPICLENILNVTNFKNNIKRKLKTTRSFSKKECDFKISWKNTMLLFCNPFVVHNVKCASAVGEMEDNNNDENEVTFSITNFNMLMYYIKANTHDLLKSVELPHPL